MPDQTLRDPELEPTLGAAPTPAPTSSAATDEPPTSVWTAVRESIRGEVRHDYTSGPIGRAVLLLAVPMVLEMLLESVFAVTDVFFVAKLGADAIATVGLTESMLALVYTLAMGLSIGAMATVARRVGEGDAEGAANTAVQAVALGLLVALGVGAAGVLLAPRLLAAMGATPSVIAMGSGYTRVMLGGSASVLLLFLVNAIFRGAGDAAIAMRTLWLANAINIVLGPCLVFGLGPFPRLGVMGAAVATTIGRSIGALYALSRLVRPGSRVHVRARHVVLHPEVMLRLVRLSGSGTVQILIGTASWIVLVRILSTFGSDAVAGYTIGMRVIMFALLPSWGLSNAAATLVGQSLGAGKPERAMQAVWRAGLYNLVFLGAIGLAFVLGAPLIVALFTHDPTVSRYATQCLRIVASGFLFYAYGMVLTQAFNGAGDTRTPTLLNLGVFWLFELPLAWFLSHRAGLGPAGAFVSVALAFSTLAVASGVLFRRGKWMKARV